MPPNESAVAWSAELEAALAARVATAEPIAGGDINEAFRVKLGDGRVVFVKAHPAPPAGMFAAEAAGLDWLRTGALPLPRVLAVGARWLALEWLALDGSPRSAGPAFEAALGAGLAELHLRGAPSFGLDRDNFLATLPQRNAPADDWPTFYVERRLRPLVELGAARGRLPALGGKLDQLAARVDRFGPPEPPARLHGDLWWGNVGAVAGQPVLIDPAVYGGHREIDLAMLALFGGLPGALIAAYDERWPLAAGWRERIALHQLYPLAAHAVLFGGGYGDQVARGVDRLL
jgi:fructosamine-3-kinase